MVKGQLKSDVCRVAAYIKVFGLNLYGFCYTNLDAGKNNLQSYFLPKGWTVTRLNRALKFLVDCGVLHKESSDVRGEYNKKKRCYSYSPLYRIFSLTNIKTIW